MDRKCLNRPSPIIYRIGRTDLPRHSKRTDSLHYEAASLLAITHPSFLNLYPILRTSTILNDSSNNGVSSDRNTSRGVFLSDPDDCSARRHVGGDLQGVEDVSIGKSSSFQWPSGKVIAARGSIAAPIAAIEMLSASAG